MKAFDAVALIEKGIVAHNPQQWADLGCGSGTFTTALVSLLPKGGRIYAVDQQPQRFDHPVKFIKANFETEDLPLSRLDGILMANSLHYVKDKKRLIGKLERYFATTENFLIVEYDTNSANPWVPYPLSFLSLQSLFTELGYGSINKLSERSSVYNRAKIYAASIQR